MDFGLAYWILMLIWLVFSAWSAWPAAGAGWRAGGGNLLLFVLLTLSGWKLFGAPLKP